MGGQDPPAVKADSGKVHVINPRWTVELRAGERTITVTGDLRWVPGPSPWPWVALAFGLAVAAIVAGRQSRWPLLLALGLGLLILVDVIHTIGTWADLRSSLVQKVSGSAITTAGWVVGVLAIWQLVKGRLSSGLFYLLFSASLIAVVGGLGDLATLGRSQLVGVLPDALTRAAVAVKAGLGLGLVLAALVRMRQMGGVRRLPTRQPLPDTGPQPDPGT
jgi:hypothetical protein